MLGELPRLSHRARRAVFLSSARILLPANLLFGPTSLRFQADPIGGGRKPIAEEISVSAGDEIQLTIPPT